MTLKIQLKRMNKIFSAFIALSIPTFLLAAETEAPLSGKITVDGSSTVFPISEAVGEEFQAKNRKVKVAIALSGTGGGFQKFCKGEVDLAGASRPISSTEIDACGAQKIAYVELPVAYDGIAIVTNPQNTWAKSLTVEELKKIWAPAEEGKPHPVKTWADVRAGFPAEKLTLYGPGPDSGTFEYFTEAIVGKKKSSRADFTAAEDDNTLVTGVEGNKGALGYFGYAYYEANKKHLSLVGVQVGKGAAVQPSPETISTFTYQPLSRPLFLYVSAKSLERPEVEGFTRFYLDQLERLVPAVGYVPLGSAINAMVKKRFDTKTVGTLYGKDTKGKLQDLLSQADQKKAAPAASTSSPKKK